MRASSLLLGLAAMVGVIVVGGLTTVLLADDPPGPVTVAVRDAEAVVEDGRAELRFPVSLDRATDAAVVVTFRAAPTRDGVVVRPRSGQVVVEPGARTALIVLETTAELERATREDVVAVRLTSSADVVLGRTAVSGSLLPDAVARSNQVRVAAAGDIACAPGDRSSTSACGQFATSDLIVAGAYDAVLTLGDNQYPSGSEEDFRRSYLESWGRVLATTRPSPGNHDYGTKDAAGYFATFGIAAGDPANGYYSFDLGGWHLVSLNSNCDSVPCGPGSEQERWLRADLAAAGTRCVLAYWHHPRFSSGSTHGSDKRTDGLYRALRGAGADLVLTGHEHHYERFGPTGPDGGADAAGPRLFVVGTGGASHYGFGDPLPTSEVRISGVFGILELNLRPRGYDWRFRPVAGHDLDAGSGTCR